MMKLTYKLQGTGEHTWIKEVEDSKEIILDIEVLNWKLKAVLIDRGLYSQVETALNGLSEPTKTIALLAWNGAPYIHITSNTTKFIQKALGLTIQEVTSIFEDAINLEI